MSDNRYLDLMRDQQAQEAQAGVAAAATKNPDEEAKLLNFSRKYNLPLETVRAQKPLVEQRAAVDAIDYTNVAANTPVLAQTLASNAPVMHDDVDVLGQIESGFKVAGSLAASSFAGLNRSILGINRSIGEAMDAVNPFGFLESSKEKQRARAYEQHLIDTNTQARDQLMPKSENPWLQGLYSGVVSTVQQAPLVAAAVLTGNPELALSGMAGTVYGDEYLKAEEKGKNPLQAAWYAAGQAGVEAITEAIPVGRLLKDIGGKSGFFKTLAHQMATEMPGEQIATVLQDFNEWVTLNPEKTVGEFLAERPNAALQTAVATVVGTGAITTVTTGADHVVRAVSDHQQKQAQAAAAEKTTALLEGVQKMAAASKLRERDPQSFEEFVASAAQETPVENVYIAAEQLNQLVTDPNVVEMLPPAIKEQFEEALETGGDVRIPVEQWASFAGSEDTAPVAKALLDHLKTDPAGMSRIEAQEFMQNEAPKLKEEIARVLGEDEQISDFQASVNRVREQFAGQFAATGRFTSDVNEQYSVVPTAFYATLAADMGITPEEAAAKYPLRITAASPAAKTPTLDQTVPVGGWSSKQLQRVVEEAGDKTQFATTMSPAEFLGLTVSPEGAQRMVDETDDYNPDLAEDAPAVQITVDDLGRVVGHDGRHRMARLLKAGVDQVPVVVKLRNRKALAEGTQVLPQRSRSDQMANGSAPITLRRLVPISADLGSYFEQRAVPETVDAVANIEAAVAFAGSQQFPTNRDFKVELQKRVLAAAKKARVDLSVFDEHTERYLSRIATSEGLQAIQTNANAVGWYNEKVTKALRLLSLVHPEIATDPQAKFAFTWALAVTSNGLKVNKNFELAERAYDTYKRTGKMPTDIGTGTAAQAINESLGKFNDLMAEHGFEKLEAFMTNFTTVKEVAAFGGKLVSGENLKTMVYGAAILGPKIGNGFFMNLYGRFEQLTMDRWLMRTWGRWTGSLIEVNDGQVKAKRTQLRGLIEGLTPETKAAFEKIIKAKLKLTDLDGTAGAIVKASMKPENRAAMKEIASGDDLRKVGNALAKYLDGQKEQPSGPPERGRIRKVFAQALRELRLQHPNITMSDFQALLWYPEKRLYDAAKTADEASTGYNDDEAPDYANAAEAVARAKGVSPEDIASTLAAVDAELSAAQRAGDVEPRSGVADDAGVGPVFGGDLGSSPGTATESAAANEAGMQAAADAQDGGRDGRAGAGEARRQLAGLRLPERVADIGDFEPGKISDLLSKHDWAMLTAENPMGVQASPEENAENMAALKAELDAAGIEYHDAVGHYGQTENSLLLLGVSEQEALDIGNRYRQDSVLTRSGLLYHDGRVVPATGVSEYENAPEDFYTYLPETGALFAVGLDFEVEQQFAQQARGTYNPSTATITLLERADLSTALHELGHHFLTVMGDVALQPGAPKRVVDDMQTILDWFGIPDVATWAGMTLDQQRDSHEKFARGFEAYLFEGKAPSPSLRGAFQRFRSWLISVYRQLTRLNVQLTPEVRGVFDRMLASQDEIAQAEREAGYSPMITAENAAALGVTPQELASLQELGSQATQDATAALEARSLRNMKWLSGARSRKIRELQREAAGKRRALRDEVTAEVMAEPVNRAREFLRYGRINGVEVEGPHKLHAEELETLSDAAKAKLGSSPKVGMLTTDSDKAINPEQVAELTGYSSADEMVYDLLNAEDAKAKIAALVDQRMLERYGDLNDAQAIADAADAAIHNDARLKAVAAEAAALAKATGGRKILNSAVRSFAGNMVAKLRIRDVRPSRYAAAERRSEAVARKEFAAGNLTEAATAKRNQLINGYATKAAHEARTEVEKALRYFARFDGNANRKAIDPDYRDQIDALLERYDLRKGVSLRAVDKRKSLAEWVRAQEALNMPVNIPDELLEDAARKHYKDMTVEELRGVVDAVRNIEHLGRLKTKLLTAKDKREFDAIVDDAQKIIIDNAVSTAPNRLESNRLRDQADIAVRSFFAMHRKFSSLIRQMGGFNDGLLWDIFVRPMNEAADREAEMMERATVELHKLFTPLIKAGGLKKKTFIPEIGASLSLEGRLMVALNWGNEDNRQRIMDGDGWTEDQVHVIIGGLTAEHWAFVQGVWDHIDSWWPQIEAKERRVTGVRPEKVEAASFDVVTPDDQTIAMRGGYFPLKYDPERSGKAEADSYNDLMKQAQQGMASRATTRRGHVKARLEKVDRAVRKDFGVIFQHVAQVTHDLAWHEYLIDASRLLATKRIDGAIAHHYGREVNRTMRDHLKDVAAGSVPAQNAFERGMNHLRSGATIAGLGWNLGTALLQPFGLVNSVRRIGPKYVARGLARWIGDAATMENGITWVHQKSSMMRLRHKTFQREVAEISTSVNTLKPSAYQAVERSFFTLISKAQMVADMPTWLGAYERAMDANDNEEHAIAIADQAVLDTQGGGAFKDLSQIQRGGPLQKLFTNFYSYMNLMQNNLAESYGELRLKGMSHAPEFAADVLLVMVIPTIMSTLLHAAMGGGDDWDELPAKLLKDQIGFLFGTMVGLREIGSLITSDGRSKPVAGLRAFSDMGDLYTQISQGEADEALFKKANAVAGTLLHYPSGQVQKTVTGFQALADGRTKNPLALVLGPPPKR